MSRTFEILERAQQDRDLFRVPPVTKALPASRASTGSENSLSDLASFTRSEVLRLVQRLFLAADSVGNPGPRQVVFCGIDDTDGAKVLCARVGRILAEQTQSQVCIVDANICAPSSSSLLDLFPFEGSSQSLDETSDGIARRLADNLWIVSGNSACTTGVNLTLDDLKTWITSHAREFAYTIISAPPVGLHTDAVLLGQAADGVVLVLEANSTRRQAALRAKHDLQSANVRVLGTVFNNRTFPIPEKIYRLL
jgi:protein-tyrosine kinase